MKLLKLVLLFCFTIIMFNGCLIEDEYKNGSSVSYCVIEDKAPRIVCINGYMHRENPLYGTTQGVFPYTTITRTGVTDAKC